MVNSSTLPAFIPDGYTRDAHIKASDFHPALGFTYRPMVPHERIRAQKKITDAKTDELGETAAHGVVVDRLQEWDLRHGDSPVEITVDNVGRLEPHLSARLFQIVMGFDADDSAELPDVEQGEADSKN